MNLAPYKQNILIFLHTNTLNAVQPTYTHAAYSKFVYVCIILK